MKRACPCCHQSFEFSLSSEDKMGNLLECPHCHSTLKWHEQELQVLHESQPTNNLTSSVEEKNISSVDLDTETAQEDDHEISTEENNEEITSDKSSLVVDEKEDSLEDTNKVADPITADSNLAKQEDEYVTPSIESTENPVKESTSLAGIDTSTAKQDLSDVAAYGNAESSTYKGLLRYDLQITGVDSSSVEAQILSILEDSRLKQDAKACLDSKKNGIVQIKNLNPVKAVYLVSQLMHLPVELSWKQYMAVNVLEEHDTGKVDIS